MSQDTQPKPWWRADEVVYTSFGIVAGAIAGAASMLIEWGVSEAYRYAEIPHGAWLPPERRWEFWDFVRDAVVGRLIVGAVAGMIFGFITSFLFCRSSRHPASVTAMWTSIVGSVGVALEFTQQNVQLTDALACAVIFGGAGAVYGFILGAAARVVRG